MSKSAGQNKKINMIVKTHILFIILYPLFLKMLKRSKYSPPEYQLVSVYIKSLNQHWLLLVALVKSSMTDVKKKGKNIALLSEKLDTLISLCTLNLSTLVWETCVVQAGMRASSGNLIFNCPKFCEADSGNIFKKHHFRWMWHRSQTAGVLGYTNIFG